MIQYMIAQKMFFTLEFLVKTIEIVQLETE